ncbi:MAG: HPF/RaiA family ribosome-associated protein [Deltaproteobacteria bacterium]|nr:HPF/RaiA family ribosome-associated protein [Deltaproteobacteria bacterium]
MELPLQITFRNLPHSPAIEAAIRERASRLERFYGHITRCRVVVEAPHQHHRRGNAFHVRIEVTVPGDEIVVRRDPPQHQDHDDMNVLVRDAFDAARRQLEDWVRRSRGGKASHEELPRGKVTKLFPDVGYGFLETTDGREVYFHENSVLGGRFESLEVGDHVRFFEELGEKGPQASTVHVGGSGAAG